MPPRRDPVIRFWEKVDKTGECWVWIAGLYRNGYGQFKPGNGMSPLAHRFSYELHFGPIPAGMQVHHTCVNPPCVNPAHLEAVTPRENTMASESRTTAAVNAAKTHCIHGHEFTRENTYMYEKRRICRQCRIETQRNRKPRMGNIGEPKREIEFEPFPIHEPVHEPAVAPSEPVHAPA